MKKLIAAWSVPVLIMTILIVLAVAWSLDHSQSDPREQKRNSYTEDNSNKRSTSTPILIFLFFVSLLFGTVLLFLLRKTFEKSDQQVKQSSFVQIENVPEPRKGSVFDYLFHFSNTQENTENGPDSISNASSSSVKIETEVAGVSNPPDTFSSSSNASILKKNQSGPQSSEESQLQSSELSASENRNPSPTTFSCRPIKTRTGKFMKVYFSEDSSIQKYEILEENV